MVGYWKSVALTAFILVLVAGRARAEDVERTIYVPQGCYMPIHKEFFGEHRPAWTAVDSPAAVEPELTPESNKA